MQNAFVVVDDFYFTFSDGNFNKLCLDGVEYRKDVKSGFVKKDPFFVAENEFLFFKMCICFFPKGYCINLNVGYVSQIHRAGKLAIVFQVDY